MVVVLVLGGTSEGRRCAAALVERGFDVVSSLAGRVSEPRLPAGAVRVGGFGGVDGLAEWLTSHRVAAVVNATHPFAERIGTAASSACARTGVPLLRLARPGWRQRAGDDWHWVDSLDSAAGLLPLLGRRAFVTTGRQGLAAFAGLRAVWLLIRCVEQPEPPLPARSRVLLSRGPYDVAAERELLRTHDIDVLVTKNSGGTMTVGKLDAARELGLPVVVVRRPERPESTASAVDAEDAVRWVTQVTSEQERD